MSIPSVNGTSRVPAASPTSSADTPVPYSPSRQAAATPDVQVDHVTQQPVPPRFPWLSRLSQALEAATGQRAAFPAAPVLGDHIDRSA